MNGLKGLAVCGSLRMGSYNLKLLNIAKYFAEGAGVKVVTADLRELNLPSYNFDVEVVGLPEPVKALSAMVKECDILLIASPEYNYSVSGVLKNALDWVSRIKPNPFAGKTAAVFGASTGPFGTVRGQNQLRQILTTLNVLVLSQPQVLVANAAEAFEADGTPKNREIAERLEILLSKTFELAGRLKTVPGA